MKFLRLFGMMIFSFVTGYFMSKVVIEPAWTNMSIMLFSMGVWLSFVIEYAMHKFNEVKS